MSKWFVLAVLGAAQFLMVLDQAVMNVAISQLVEDFGTTVTTIQMVIACYALVMAALMVTGGKLGDLWGRKRTFSVGLVIYAIGSALTAASWSVPSLLFGWSILEGIGAALVIPALVALVAANYEGKDRAIAYGVLGGIAGAGIAVGPIIGGYATTELSWRVVFVGEVVIAAFILLGTMKLSEPAAAARKPQLDWVGSVLAALGLSVIVLGVLQASNWGWLRPLDSPVEPFGFSLTPFVIAAGVLVLGGFRSWERRREKHGLDPLIHFKLFQNGAFRGGLSMLLAQNLILMGIFFTVPLYLQVVQGLDALETGVRMLPASAGLFIAALGGSALASRFAPRPLVRVGLAVTLVSTLLMLEVIGPELDDASFLVAMGVLGLGMGLIVSQLGNVAQSAVSDRDRSEAGGLQGTAQQLGSSLGTALLGAVVITGLIAAFTSSIGSDPAVSESVRKQVQVEIGGGVSFVSADEVRAGAEEAGASPETTDALVTHYEDAQLAALKTAFLFAGFIVLASFWTSRRLPVKRLGTTGSRPEPPDRETAPDAGLDELAELLDLERADQVDEPLHQRPDPGEDEQQVLLLDEELAAGPEGEDDHQEPGDQPEPPELVDLAGGHGLQDPEDADEQEEEAEHVGERVERVLGADQRDHPGDQEEHAEEPVEPGAAFGHRSDGELLEPGRQEHDPDDHADGRDRGVVELEDDGADDHPGEAEDDPEPPEAGDPLDRLARLLVGVRGQCVAASIVTLPWRVAVGGSLPWRSYTRSADVQMKGE